MRDAHVPGACNAGMLPQIRSSPSAPLQDRHGSIQWGSGVCAYARLCLPLVQSPTPRFWIISQVVPAHALVFIPPGFCLLHSSVFTCAIPSYYLPSKMLISILPCELCYFFKLHDLNISNLSYLKTRAVIVLRCFFFLLSYLMYLGIFLKGRCSL